MDFTRNGANAPQGTRSAGQVATSSENSEKAAHHTSGRGGGRMPMWARLGTLVLLFAATALLVSVAWLVAYSDSNQSKYIDTSKYQAVFLNNDSTTGQSVYFGKIATLNDKYLVLQDIYYLTTTGSSSTSSSSTTSNANNSNYTLTKLGCQQLHDPYDQMVINMSDVAFWENLQDSGKVVSAITQYQKQNPNGPNCSQSSSSVGTSNTTTQNNSSTNP